MESFRAEHESGEEDEDGSSEGRESVDDSEEDEDGSSEGRESVDAYGAIRQETSFDCVIVDKLLDLQDFSWKSTEAHKFVENQKDNNAMQGEQNIGLPPGSSFSLIRDPLGSFPVIMNCKESISLLQKQEGTRNVELCSTENDSEDEDGSYEGRKFVAANNKERPAIQRENAVASLIHDNSFQETSSRCKRSSPVKRETSHKNENSETKSQVKKMNRLNSINCETLNQNDTNEVSFLSKTLRGTSLESFIL